MEIRHYDWQPTFSRQTGTQGEFCLVIGGKGIGKTFGLRLQVVKDYLKSGDHFCEICRTKEEFKNVRQGYFEKLHNDGFFEDYLFRIQGQIAQIAKRPAVNIDGEFKTKPVWDTAGYFASLTAFQTEKKRTYTNISKVVFDEAIIDSKDRYHRYLPNEFLIFANLLDSISRQQPGGKPYRVYLLGNACDLSCPYFRHFGINKIPEFGYSFWHGKSVLLHYVEPWDQEQREALTLVGRMLAGTEESRMVFGNKFISKDTKDIGPKSQDARYEFGIRYGEHTFGIWMDYKQALCWISEKMPKKAKNVMSLTKKDMTLDYIAIDRSSPYLKLINKLFYDGALRYDSVAAREAFISILDYLGVR